jgi:hypothetical protein
MNSVIERVNQVCQCVRTSVVGAISFKKLVCITRKQFKQHDVDLVIKTKTDKSLENDQFYVMAYYDPEDDYFNETSIEVVVYHNFDRFANFEKNQITEFLIQIFDAVVHELRHQLQSRQRQYEIYSDHLQEPFSAYLADPDELDAYALSIAIELLRTMPPSRAKRYMTRISVLSKMKQNNQLVSVNLNAYVSYFYNTELIKKLAKKVYKHLESIDRNNIFM